MNLKVFALYVWAYLRNTNESCASAEYLLERSVRQPLWCRWSRSLSDKCHSYVAEEWVI